LTSKDDKIEAMKKLLLLLVLGFISPLFTIGSAYAIGAYPSGSSGYDVSYPNCNARKPSGAFGIVGVTGGLNFSQNPCLPKENGWFKGATLYLNSGYPGYLKALNYQNSPRTCQTTDLNCLAYNYGYNAGLYAVNYAKSLNVKSATWWLDVETMNTWQSDTVQNRQSIQGEYDALSSNTIDTIGAYSTTAQWDQITGTWKPGWPSWGASTWRTAKQAATFCTGHEFTGGTTYLIQYTGKLDQDYAC